MARFRVYQQPSSTNINIVMAPACPCGQTSHSQHRPDTHANTRRHPMRESRPDQHDSDATDDTDTTLPLPARRSRSRHCHFRRRELEERHLRRMHTILTLLDDEITRMDTPARRSRSRSPTPHWLCATRHLRRMRTISAMLNGEITRLDNAIDGSNSHREH